MPSGARTGVVMLLLSMTVGPSSAQAQPATAPTETARLPEMDATSIVKMLCSRQITARQYLESLYARLYADGFACLNAFQYVNVSQALAQADAIDARAAAGEDVGPLCGLPLAVKDSTDVLGLPTSAGTAALVGKMPPLSAPLIDKYLNSNGIIMGKTALHELSAGGTSVGPTSNNLTSVLNPWNVIHHAGGSSGGAGAALAACLTPLASCEDTGGSCRLPASATGTVGLRPSLGCYDYGDGLAPFGFTRDTVGSMARNMDDLLLLDSILRSGNISTRGHGALPAPGVSCAVQPDPDFSLQGINIGLPVDYWEVLGVDPEIMPVFEEAMEKMTAAGITLIDINMSTVLSSPGALYSLLNFEPGREFSRYLYTHNYTESVKTVFDAINHPTVAATVSGGLGYGINTPEGNVDAWADYLGRDRPDNVANWAATYEAYNLTALFYPVFTVDTRKIDEVDPNCVLPSGEVGSCISTFVTNDDSQAAQTVLALPLGLSQSGMPVGGNFAGPLGADERILSLGLALEKIIGRFPAPPSPPGCIGCTAHVTNQTVTYSGVGPVGANDVWSALSLRFEGDCLDNELNTYGEGMSGMGPVAVAG